MRHRSTLGSRAARTPSIRPRRSAPRSGVLRIAPARLLLGCLVTVGIAALLLAVPVVSGRVTNPPPAALQTPALGAQSTAGSVVVMGEDGTPLPGLLSLRRYDLGCAHSGAATPTTAAGRAASAVASAGGTTPVVGPSSTGRVAAGAAGHPRAGGGSSPTSTTSSSAAATTSSSSSQPSAPTTTPADPSTSEPSEPILPTDILPDPVGPRRCRAGD